MLIEMTTTHSLIRPPLGNGKCGPYRGMASREGYTMYQIQLHTVCSVKLWLHKRGGLWSGWPHEGGATVFHYLKIASID